MNLERRTFLVVFVTLVVATGVAFAVAQAVVFHSVQALEHKRAQENLNRATQAIRYEIETLDHLAADWAHWDDAYAFVQDLDPDFEASNLVESSFKNQHVDAMMFFNVTGGLVYGASYDAATGAIGALPDRLLLPDTLAPLMLHPYADRSVAGILMVDGAPVLVSSWPILTSDVTGPAVGTMIWTRALDAQEIATLQRNTLLDMTVSPWPVARQDGEVASLAASGSPDAMILQPRSSSSLAATGLLTDVSGQPALAVQVKLDRPIYEQSVQNLAFGLASTILVGGGILVLITMMLDRTVFTPLHRLTRDVDALGAGKPGSRVSALRDDEIGYLATSFNRLMGRLDRDKVDLERSNQDLRDFAAVVSHDLQPPLSTIALNAAVVRERERTRLDPDALQRLDRMEATALRMAQHIRSILDYSRVASQDAPIADVNLNEVMEDVINDLEERLHATAGRIEYRSLPTIQGNTTQLAQLLLNLMGNALKYHRPGVPPVVKVHAEPYSDGKGWTGWRLVVEDNGIGFDPAELDKMVRPYTRLEHRVEGYGLGLATCHKIIERHHGRLTAHSVPDQGSAFMVDLPSKQPTDDDNAAHRPRPAV